MASVLALIGSVVRRRKKRLPPLNPAFSMPILATRLHPQAGLTQASAPLTLVFSKLFLA